MWHGVYILAMITKPLLQDLRGEIDAALAVVGARHGLAIKAGSATFNPQNAVFKLNISVLNASGEAVTKEQSDLKHALPRFGLNEAHLTQEFVYGSETFVLHGYRAKARSRPFLIKRVCDGKVFLGSETGVLKALGVDVIHPGPQFIPTR